jgi:hypothetical protein
MILAKLPCTYSSASCSPRGVGTLRRVRMPTLITGTVEGLENGDALIRLPDGDSRTLHVPDRIQVHVGMTVKIQEMPDGSPPVIAWGV